MCADGIESLSTAVGGRCTKIRRRPAQHYAPFDAPCRGKIRDFSRRSRTRLQQTLCAMPVAHVARGVLFVTLTYPASYPGDWQQWKRQLGAWFDRVRRRLPAAAAVWKLEPQKRGAPHFHLLVVGVPFLSKDWLSRSWYEVVGSGDLRHLRAGTQVQLARSHRGVVSYAAKYTAKPEHLPADWQDGVGRWWGVYNRRGLGIVWCSVALDQDEFWQLTRLFRRLVRSRNRSKPRGPPRRNQWGSWVVMSDTNAARAALWATTSLMPEAPLAIPARGRNS